MFAGVSYGTQMLDRGFTFGCLINRFSKCGDNTRDTSDACSSPPKVVTTVSPGFEIKRKHLFSLDRNSALTGTSQPLRAASPSSLLQVRINALFVDQAHPTFLLPWLLVGKALDSPAVHQLIELSAFPRIKLQRLIYSNPSQRKRNALRQCFRLHLFES